MGSPEETSAASNPPNPKVIASPTTSPPAAAPPPASAVTSQEVPAMAAYPDWCASMHAYFTSGAPAVGTAPPAAFFQPAHWAGQMMAPYGTPIPYSPLYYAHPSMSAGTPYPNPESEGRPSDGKDRGSAKKPNKATSGKSGNGGKVTSDSGYDDATQSGESGSEGSSSTGGESTNPQASIVGRKRASSDAFGDGEGAHPGTQYGNSIAEASHSGRAAKLPVSAPGRAALPGPATNLNIGLDVWNAPHAGTGAMKIGPNAMGIASVMPDHQWNQMDERELKREKRKQSNRESARRSRMKKQEPNNNALSNTVLAQLNARQLAQRARREKERSEKFIQQTSVSTNMMVYASVPSSVTTLHPHTPNLVDLTVNHVCEEPNNNVLSNTILAQPSACQLAQRARRENERSEKLIQQTSVSTDLNVIHVSEENAHAISKGKETTISSSKRREIAAYQLQECEELAKKVAELSGENSTLRIELGKLKKDFEELQAENISLMGHLKSKKPDLLTEEEHAFVYDHSATSVPEGVNGSNPSTALSVGEVS